MRPNIQLRRSVVLKHRIDGHVSSCVAILTKFHTHWRSHLFSSSNTVRNATSKLLYSLTWALTSYWATKTHITEVVQDSSLFLLIVKLHKERRNLIITWHSVYCYFVYEIHVTGCIFFLKTYKYVTYLFVIYHANIVNWYKYCSNSIKHTF